MKTAINQFHKNQIKRNKELEKQRTITDRKESGLKTGEKKLKRTLIQRVKQKD